MKRFLSCIVLLALGASAPAATISGFTGEFELSKWTLASSAGGSIDLSGAPDMANLVGSDDGSGLGATQSLTILAPAAGTVSIAWKYESLDTEPVWDAFGFLVNGLFNSISVSTDGLVQSGSYSFDVAAGDVFGFGIESFDSTGGAATAWVSGFEFVEAPVSTVPEPGTLALIGLALALNAVPRTRRHAGHKEAV